jgi:hypothetical protein
MIEERYADSQPERLPAIVAELCIAPPPPTPPGAVERGEGGSAPTRPATRSIGGRAAPFGPRLRLPTGRPIFAPTDRQTGHRRNNASGEVCRPKRTPTATPGYCCASRRRIRPRSSSKASKRGPHLPCFSLAQFGWKKMHLDRSGSWRQAHLRATDLRPVELAGRRAMLKKLIRMCSASVPEAQFSIPCPDQSSSPPFPRRMPLRQDVFSSSRRSLALPTGAQRRRCSHSTSWRAPSSLPLSSLLRSIGRSTQLPERP